MSDKKKVLVVGGGGRCHAIVEALSRSDEVGKIYCAPGNAGIASLAECVPLCVTDVEGLLDFAKSNRIDMTVVGPEAALAEGIADRFRENGLKIFGPGKDGARMETSKEFAKIFMMKHGIPTASYKAFDDYEDALEYVKAGSLPIVLKYDGLAAGKGVVVAMTLDEAQKALHDMLVDDSFGKGRVVVEEFLEGPEFSFMCLLSRDKVYPLEMAQDHKRAYDQDKGPNTGGMGAYSPVPFITEEIRERALNEIMRPVAKALAEEGIDYCGVLYGGLILTKEGPKVIEFNARFGDPETEVVLPRIKSDFYNLIDAVIDGRDFEIEWHPESIVGVVMASKGYPGKSENGFVIKGKALLEPGTYHMGTKLNEENQITTAGGRVLMVTAKGKDIAEAQNNAYIRVSQIECDNLFNRTDIAYQAI